MSSSDSLQPGLRRTQGDTGPGAHNAAYRTGGRQVPSPTVRARDARARTAGDVHVATCQTHLRESRRALSGGRGGPIGGGQCTVDNVSLASGRRSTRCGEQLERGEGRGETAVVAGGRENVEGKNQVSCPSYHPHAGYANAVSVGVC